MKTGEKDRRIEGRKLLKRLKKSGSITLAQKKKGWNPVLSPQMERALETGEGCGETKV